MSGSLSAGRAFAKECDLPDPLNLADFSRRPDLLAAAARRRRENGWTCGRPHDLAYPKPAGGARSLTRLDPVADVIFRQLVGRLIGTDRLLSDGVHNTRIEMTAHGWRSVPWRSARPSYERDLESIRRAGDMGEIHMDVRNHYDTVTPTLIQRVLNSAGVPSGAVGDLVGWLEDLDSVPGVSSGLPTGPEGSAVLGTWALLPLDRMLAGHGYDLIRWSDDYVVPAAGPGEFDLVVEAASVCLGNNGQALNLDKCQYVGPGEAEVGGASGLESGARVVADPHVELEISAWLEKPRGVPGLLGLLRRHADARGIATLKSHPWLVERFPRQSAAYLRAVTAHVGWDWVIDVVLAPTTLDNAAAQLHLLRVVPPSALTPDVATALFDGGSALERTTFAPVANQCFASAGRSSEPAAVRQRRALEAAVELSDLDAQRALLTAFDRAGGLSRSSRQGLAHLSRTSPELAAAADWALAA